MSRQKNGIGEANAISAQEVSQATLATLAERSALSLLDAAFAQDGWPENTASNNPLIRHALYQDKDSGDLVAHSTKLSVPLIALGASAATHYPAIASLLGAELIVPEHADVAGAVGAAAGSVRQRVMITITQPAEGRFRVHLPDGPKDLKDKEEALALGRERAETIARSRAEQAGAISVSLSLSEDINEVQLTENKTLFIEAVIQAQATGVPAV